MSILSKFFSRKAAKDQQQEAVVINRVKSFKLEFPDKNPIMVHDGHDLMQCTTDCYVVINGISMSINANFTLETPVGDGFTLEDVVFVDYFLPSRSAMSDGTPTPVAFSHIAIIEVMTYIKAQLSYDDYTTNKEEEEVYLCI